MSQAVQKSSISVLDECCKRKLQPPPVYTFTSDDSASDFLCTVTAFNETKSGKAKSKKKAKHAAAENLINLLRSLESFRFDLVFLNTPPNFLDETKVSSSTTSENKRKASTKSPPETNYVGKLQEYCVKNKLPPPSFDLIEHTTNTQTQSGFSIKCSVNEVAEEGKGFNKKEAKQRAAMGVFNSLTAGMPKDSSKIDEPPIKQSKTIGKSNDGPTTLSTTSEDIVPEGENFNAKI